MLELNLRTLAIVLALPILTLGPLSACSPEPGASTEAVGVIQLPLTAPGASGKAYRIKNLILRIQGPKEVNLQGADTDVVLTSELPVGEYLLTVQEGYQVVEITSAGEKPVTATLTSKNPQSFTVTNQAITNLALTFDATGDGVSFGNGRVKVTASVTDKVVPGSLPLGACNTISACYTFDDGNTSGWTPVGSASVVNGAYVLNGGATQPKAYMMGTYASVAIEADVPYGAGLIVRGSHFGPYVHDYWGYDCVILQGGDKTYLYLDKVHNGLNDGNSVELPGYDPSKSARMRLVAFESNGSVQLDCYLNNELKVSFTDTSSPEAAGSVGLLTWGGSVSYAFDNVKVQGL